MFLKVNTFQILVVKLRTGENGVRSRPGDGVKGGLGEDANTSLLLVYVNQDSKHEPRISRRLRAATVPGSRGN